MKRTIQNISEEKNERNGPRKRAAAVFCLILIAGLIIGLLYAAFTGASAGVLLAFFFCLTVVPCVIYGLTAYIRMTARRRDQKDDSD